MDDFQQHQQQPDAGPAAAESAEDSVLVRARITRGAGGRETVVADGDEAAAALNYKHTAGTK